MSIKEDEHETKRIKMKDSLNEYLIPFEKILMYPSPVYNQFIGMNITAKCIDVDKIYRGIIHKSGISISKHDYLYTSFGLIKLSEGRNIVHFLYLENNTVQRLSDIEILDKEGELLKFVKIYLWC